MTLYLVSVRAMRMGEYYRTETHVRTHEGPEHAAEVAARAYGVEMSEVMVLEEVE